MKPFLLLLRAGSARFFTALFYKKKKKRSIARLTALLLLLNIVFTNMKAADLPGIIQGNNNGIEAPFTISIQINTTNVSACGNGSDATINATPSGGTAPYTYSWTGPSGFTSTNQNLTGLRVGYYNVTVTDANLVLATVTAIHISFAFSPTITNSGSNSGSCNSSGSIILYGSAGVQPYTFSLDGTNYQASNTFTGLAAGTYTAYLKDLRGCTATKSITVLSTAPIVVTSLVRPASNCNNDGSIELYRSGGVGPYTYSLDDVNYQASNVFTGLAAGSVFTGWVMDAQGCKGSLANLVVTQVPPLAVTVGRTNSSTCINDGTIQIGASGGVTPYTYSVNDVTYQSGSTFSNLAPGTYTCWVKDFKGCKVSISVTISLNPIIVTAYTGSSNGCNTNGSIQLFKTGGTGPFTYSLNNITYTTTNIFSNLSGGVYTGWVKDSRGCKGSLTGITVVTGAAITVSVSKTNTSACVNSGVININASGGTPPLSYSLNNNTFQPGNSFTQLGAGNYVCCVKDANGCKAFVNATINISQIIVTAAVTNVVNCILPDGTILISRTGGTGGFTYSIDGDNYQTSNLFTGVEAGEYTAFVKDSNICIGTLSNIVVTTSCVSFTGKQPVYKENSLPAIRQMKINAYPNPTATEFILSMEGYSNNNISITVTDIMGRTIYQVSGSGKQQYTFGKDFTSGLYNVQVVQGNDKKSIRIVKQ